MDCSPPGSSVHGDSPGKNTGVGCHAFLQGIFPTQGSNPGLLHCRRILYCLSHQGRLFPPLVPASQPRAKWVPSRGGRIKSFPTSEAVRLLILNLVSWIWGSEVRRGKAEVPEPRRRSLMMTFQLALALSTWGFEGGKPELG